MSVPKGKHQSGQTEQTYQPGGRWGRIQYSNCANVRGNSSEVSRGADVQFSGNQGYQAAVAAATHSTQQHSAYSAHTPQAQQSHAQGSVSGTPGGNMRSGMHHSNAGANSQSGQSSQQQQSGAATSTPPGGQQQQHGELNKQAQTPQSHMQGQQTQVPGTGHIPLNYMPSPHARHQHPYIRPINPRMTGHRGLQVNNISPQQIGYSQVSHHPVYPSNIPNHQMFQQQILQYQPQGRGGNSAVQGFYPNQPYFVPPAIISQASYNQPQNPQFYNTYSQQAVVGPLVRPGMMNQQQSQQQPSQQGASHVANTAAQATQVPSSAMQPGPPLHEKQQRRRPNAIAIVHPETGKDLLDELCEGSSNSTTAATPPRSGDSSARQTPQLNVGSTENSIAFEFAYKVACAAGRATSNDRRSNTAPPSRTATSECGPPRAPANAVPVQVNGPSIAGVVSEPNSPSILQEKQSVPHQPNDNLAELTSKADLDGWKSKSSSSSPSPSPQTSKEEFSEHSNQTVLGYAAAVNLTAPVASDSVTCKEEDTASPETPTSLNDSSSTEGNVQTCKTGINQEARDDTSKQTAIVNPVSANVVSTLEQSNVPVASPVLSAAASIVGRGSSPLTVPVTSLPQRAKRDTPLDVVRQQPSPVPTPSVDDANGEVDSDGKGAQWQQAKGRNKQVQREVMKKRGTEKEATAVMEADKHPTPSNEEEEEVCSSTSTTTPSSGTPVSASAPSPPPTPVPAVSPTSDEQEELEVSSDTGTSSPALSSQVKIEAEPALTKAYTKKIEIPSTDKDKLVAALNEENSRATTEAQLAQVPLTSSPPAVIEKPVETSKLVYTKDQWSPLNTDGKKKYERDFLMQLKNDPQSLKRPEDLPKLEVVCDTYKNRNNDTRPIGGGLTRGGSNADSLLMPKFMNHTTPRGSLLKRNSQQGKPKAPKVIQLNLSLNEDVKLNETENAWRPTRMQPKAEEVNVVQEELYKKVRSVLNKLTPQKFDLLVDQVKALPIDTKEKLEGVINLVFEKAVDEPSFSVAYAMMCQTLSNMHVPVAKNKDGKQSSESVYFKKLLLMRCQAEFEKQRDTTDDLKREERNKEVENADSEKRKEIEMQLEEEDRRIRMKYVGVNRFIGELYKRNMLTANIMVQCISKLLEANDEESLECLCKLLTTIGKELETRVEKDKKPVDLTHHFQRMQNIVDARKTSSRIRFMLQDVIDLRAGKWRPRRGDSNPKTMDEIAKEAERESLIQVTAPQPHTLRGKEERDRDRDRDRKRGRGGVSDDGWTTAGGGGRISTPRGPLEINKLKVKHPDMDVLGSKSQFTSWSKGSAGYKTKTEMPGAPGGNPYSVLSVDTDKPGMLTTPASSRSSGRDAALAEARKITSVGDTPPVAPRLSRPNSRDSSRDSSVMREEREETSGNKTEPATSIKGPQVMSESELDRKAKLLIEEYISAENQQDLFVCVQEEVHTSQVAYMLSRWMLLAFEWTYLKRSKTANAMVALCKNRIVPVGQLLNALEEIFAMSDDLLIDIPMTYRYLAELVVPLLICDAISFDQLRDVLRAVKNLEGAQKFLLECMKLLQKEVGPGWIVPRWKAAEMSWSDYVPDNKAEQFLIENGLTYMLEDSKEREKLITTLVQLPHQVMGMQEMHNRLRGLMPDGSYDDIVQWIAVNIGKEIQTPKYIRALMTVICEVGTFQDKSQQWKLNTELFDRHSKLIQRYVSNIEELELQALYAIQAYVTRRMHPSSLLKNILNNLLEENILSRDSIQAWVRSEDPAEAEGRGVALKSINQFIAWLNEPDYDSESFDGL